MVDITDRPRKKHEIVNPSTIEMPAGVVAEMITFLSRYKYFDGAIELLAKIERVTYEKNRRSKGT